jgi:hypothetical protein
MKQQLMAKLKIVGFIFALVGWLMLVTIPMELLGRDLSALESILESNSFVWGLRICLLLLLVILIVQQVSIREMLKEKKWLRNLVRIIVLGGVVGWSLALGSLFIPQPEAKITVSNFEECAALGNPVMESYPRQCRHEGVLYVEMIPSSVGQVCTESTECELPMEYAVRSNCPYQAACREGACVVVCPMWEHSPDVTESVSYQVACTSSESCDCGAWDSEQNFPCECLDGQCASVVDY